MAGQAGYFCPKTVQARHIMQVYFGGITVEVVETEQGFVVDGQTIRSKTRALSVAFAIAQKRSFAEQKRQKLALSIVASAGGWGGSRVKLSKK